MWDSVGACALIVWNAVAVVGLIILLTRDWPHYSQMPVALRTAARLAALAWLTLQIYFLCVRIPPRTKLDGWAPRLTALAAAHASGIIISLPTNNLPTLQLASATLSIIGTVGSIYTLSYLGRAFSIFPQSRRLVIGGPYSLIRHPLYLFEQIVTFGVALLYTQPWALIIATASFALQFPRMSFEEQILTTTFPEYRSYMQRTWRLLPGIY
jgi:protein-S-isoprenylcysteine O-methyltransferase Ste14